MHGVPSAAAVVAFAQEGLSADCFRLTAVVAAEAAGLGKLLHLPRHPSHCQAWFATPASRAG